MPPEPNDDDLDPNREDQDEAFMDLIDRAAGAVMMAKGRQAATDFLATYTSPDDLLDERAAEDIAQIREDSPTMADKLSAYREDRNARLEAAAAEARISERERRKEERRAERTRVRTEAETERHLSALDLELDEELDSEEGGGGSTANPLQEVFEGAKEKFLEEHTEVRPHPLTGQPVVAIKKLDPNNPHADLERAHQAAVPVIEADMAARAQRESFQPDREALDTAVAERLRKLGET